MTGRTTSGTSGGATTGDDEVAAAARLVADLARATAGTPADLRRLAGLLGDRYGPDSRLLARGVELALLDAVADPGARGWGARDLVEIVRRRVGASAVPLVLDVVAGEAARRPHGGGPEDVAELAALGAEVWWDRGRPLLEQWAATRRLAPPAALRAGLGIVHTLRTLPTLPRREGAAGAPPGVDARVLARVRGLLAKAESTTFAEEAEALSAKAQELMARHALEAAVVGAVPTGAGPGGEAGTRRIWLDAPYASAKAHLVHRVASANRCRAVTLDALDMVTVVGHPADLGTVELLVTSLLVQADRAMLTSSEAEAVGRERTRSFRHAFLLSYATRIGERLAAATHEAQVRARAEVGESLLPVLAARAEVVDAAVGELFPRITTRRASVGNRDGWFAGRAAADAASLSPGRDALDR